MKMKQPLKKKLLPAGVTTVAPLPGVQSLARFAPGAVVITHHQGYKQSHDYQSFEAGYSLTVTCEDTKAAIKATTARIEELTEDLLARKFQEHRALLVKLAGQGKD